VPPLLVNLRPEANFRPPDLSVIIEGGAPTHFAAVADDWDDPGDPPGPDLTPDTWIGTETRFNSTDNSGGYYVGACEDLRDEFGVSVRPASFADHKIRILYRNQHGTPTSTARFFFGLARGGQNVYMFSRSPTHSNWLAEEVDVPVDLISLHLGSLGDYNNINVFCYADGNNPPQATEAWALNCAHISLLVPDPTTDRVTRHGVEVLAKHVLQVRATRHAAEALTKREGVQVTRHGVEVLYRTPIRATRLGVEILAKFRQEMRATRVGVEVLAKRQGQESRATRLGVEVLAKVQGAAATRLGTEVLSKRQGVQATRHAVEVLSKYLSGSLEIRATRVAVEVVSKIPFARDTVEPLSFPIVPPNLLRADWGAELTVESAYSTDVTRAATTIAEERRALVDRPYRTFGVRFVGQDSERVLQATMNLARRGHTRTILPIYPDFAVVKKLIAPDFIGCDPLYRRFHRGQRVVIHTWSGVNPGLVEYAVVRSVNAEGLELVSPLAGSFPKGSRVYPLVDVEIALEAGLESLVSDALRQTLTLAEVIGKSALPALATGAPPEPHHVDGFPILVLSPDWASGLTSRVVRHGSQIGSGRGLVTGLAGARPVFVHEAKLKFLNRAAFWRVLRFFDSRLGRARTFWAVSPQALFVPTAIPTSTTIDVKQSGNLSDLQAFLQHIGIVRRDGSVTIHKVSSIVVQGSDWRVTVIEPHSLSGVGEIRRLTSAHFGRYFEDSLLEEWSTDNVCESRFQTIELLEEKAVTIPDVVEGLTVTGPDSVTGLFAWFDSGLGTFTSPSDMAGPTILRTSKAVPGDAVSAWDDVRTPAGGLPSLAGAALAADRPKLVFMENPELNNNRRSMRFDSGPRWFRFRTSDASENADPFWDNTLGLTVFLNVRLTAEQFLERKFVWRSGILEWDSLVVRLYENDGSGAVTLTMPPGWALGSTLRTLALVWKPNDYIRLYRNGGAPVVEQTAQKIIDLPTVARVTDICKFAGDVTSQSDEFAIGLDPFLNSAIFYRRALNNAGLNGVGTFLANAFGTPWTTVT